MAGDLGHPNRTPMRQQVVDACRGSVWVAPDRQSMSALLRGCGSRSILQPERRPFSLPHFECEHAQSKVASGSDLGFFWGRWMERVCQIQHFPVCRNSPGRVQNPAGPHHSAAPGAQQAAGGRGHGTRRAMSGVASPRVKGPRLARRQRSLQWAGHRTTGRPSPYRPSRPGLPHLVRGSFLNGPRTLGQASGPSRPRFPHTPLGAALPGKTFARGTSKSWFWGALGPCRPRAA